MLNRFEINHILKLYIYEDLYETHLSGQLSLNVKFSDRVEYLVEF